MLPIRTLIASAVLTLPLAVAAQTANTPGGQAATGTPLDQTKSSPQKSTPATTSTTPDATNPSGSLSHGMSNSTSGSGSSMSKSKTRNTDQMGKGTTTAAPAGDVPTYPAPAKDGTPTK